MSDARLKEIGADVWGADEFIEMDKGALDNKPLITTTKNKPCDIKPVNVKPDKKIKVENKKPTINVAPNKNTKGGKNNKTENAYLYESDCSCTCYNAGDDCKCFCTECRYC